MVGDRGCGTHPPVTLSFYLPAGANPSHLWYPKDMARKKRAPISPELRAQLRAERAPEAKSDRAALRQAGRTLREERPAPTLQHPLSVGDLVRPRGQSVAPDGSPLVGVILELAPRSALVLWSVGISDWWAPTILRRVEDGDE